MSSLDERTPLRRLVADSVLTGLCPLIPIPLLDDYARDLLRKGTVARLAAAAGTPLSDAEAKILACGYHPPDAAGCAGGCLRAALVRPIVFLFTLVLGKLMRKILFVLTLKDGAVTFSQSFHEAYLVRHALALGAQRQPAVVAESGASGPDPRLLEVRTAVEAVVQHTDTRPVTRLARSVFAGSGRLAVAAARRMTRVLRRRRRAGEAEITERLEREGEVGLSALIDELTRDLEAQGGYLEDLKTALEARLGGKP